jgi:purine-binding chemotaxis protein CheW
VNHPNRVVAAADAAERSIDLQVLTIVLGDQVYGVDVLFVQEIRGFSRLTALPGVDPSVKGLMNLRGTVIPVLDLRTRLGLPDRLYDKFTLVVVVKTYQGRLVGLVVDGVSAVKKLDVGHVNPVPHQDAREMVAGVARFGAGLILLLNLDAVISVVDDVKKAEASDAQDAQTPSSESMGAEFHDLGTADKET